MQLHLVDINEEMVAAWKVAFRDLPNVFIRQGNLLSNAENCVVSPANSYGFMDGGIDAAYRSFFGAGIEQKVRSAIDLRPERILPVGASLVIQTGHLKIPYLIVAPTMTMPEGVEASNCYRAMRAVLRVVESVPEIGRMVYCPGLGTGVGMVAPNEAAAMMERAYRDWMSARK
jgi:O-acetyl-ADP-ribose deacetylase (regulator of RNase III)